MSYIRCFDNYSPPYYVPTGNLQGLFNDLVVQPFEDHPRTTAWINLVKNKDSNYHRVEILHQGRTNFNEWHEGLSPKDKVDLYCVHYMPMHLFSSYHIFTQYLTSVSNRVVFIDFGCGPLTSGIAFWASARSSNMIYLGIDSSQAMLEKAKEINQYGHNQRRDPFFKNFQAIDDYHKLTSLLAEYIRKGDRTLIIFNFCYFLASETLDIYDLSECLNRIVEEYSGHNQISMIYQNPRPAYFHTNWIILKKQFSTFRSQITQSNIEEFHCNWFRLNNGQLIMRRSTEPIQVYCDILSNDPLPF